MIVINDDYRLLHGGRVKEGGLARNESILRWLEDNKAIEEVRLDRSRSRNAAITLKTLRQSKNETIFLFYPTVGIPVLKEGTVGMICSDLFISALNKACKNNRVIVDICDLKYEQAIDLEIDKDRRKIIERTEKSLFGCQCEFVFASESMKEYAVNKYHISSPRCTVLDNGGNLDFAKMEVPHGNNKLKAVYAGTLNKGRCIESMIESMNDNHNVILYLCGAGGDWIEEKENVKYLGALDESSAHYFVSYCDIGLIPYDEKKLYYNIAYPTKLAFYITAGIPFLSTNVTEVKKVHDKYGIGYLSRIEEWRSALQSFDSIMIATQKKKIEKIKNEFTWKYKCEHSILNKI